MEGQITIDEYLIHQRSVTHCGVCVCRNCMLWWSQRCPYGECYDDYRVVTAPYDKAHSDETPKTQWSNWNEPREQAHWCRGGMFYPVRCCEHFVKYKGQQVKECLKAKYPTGQRRTVLFVHAAG